MIKNHSVLKENRMQYSISNSQLLISYLNYNRSVLMIQKQKVNQKLIDYERSHLFFGALYFKKVL